MNLYLGGNINIREGIINISKVAYMVDVLPERAEKEENRIRMIVE